MRRMVLLAGALVALALPAAAQANERYCDAYVGTGADAPAWEYGYEYRWDVAAERCGRFDRALGLAAIRAFKHHEIGEESFDLRVRNPSTRRLVDARCYMEELTDRREGVQLTCWPLGRHGDVVDVEGGLERKR